MKVLKQKIKNPIIVLDNHRFDKPAIGKIEFIDSFDTSKIDWDKMCFGAGYIPKKIDKDGNITDVELLEISLIECLQIKEKDGDYQTRKE